MFVSGCGLHVTSDPFRPGVTEPDPCRADGRSRGRAGGPATTGGRSGLVKMYGSTGSDQERDGLLKPLATKR